MNDFFALLAGVACAGIGGELFVRGAVGLAGWARVSRAIVGVTVAAFATSSPEMSVSISAAMAGSPEISLGDALGSNVVNVALILGIALLFSGMQTSRDGVKRDFSVALLIPTIIGALLLDGELSRLDGLLMLSVFFAWLVATTIEANKQRSGGIATADGHRRWRVILPCVVGLAFLVAAGNLIVIAAQGIALSFGVDEFIVGATVVAIGTSTPELATTLIAKLRGHDEIGLGTLLGSNIYNGAFVVAVAAIIHPITVAWGEISVALVFGLAAVAFCYPSRSGSIERWRGPLLLALYATYLVLVVRA